VSALYDLKLILYKRGINLITLVASRILPKAEGKYPQTKILLRVFDRLFKVFHVERFKTGTRGLEDQNFRRLLDVSVRALAYISENDRYYRQWLGLLYLLIDDELESERKNLSRKEFVSLMREQWLLKGWSKLSEGMFQHQKEALFPLVLTDYLHTVSMMDRE
jgi:hypothetical protein